MNATTDEVYDVIVVGGGAAGLMGASRLGELGCKTLVLEKNRKPAVKILMSGGTRCNLTQNTDARGIIRAFGPRGKFLHSALSRLDPPKLVQLFADEGVPTQVESTGKIFPTSNKALDVQQALLRRLDRFQVDLKSAAPVTAITPKLRERSSSNTSSGVTLPTWFEVQTESETFSCRRLLLTTGGLSYPGCGTTGDGYAWCSAMGHSIVSTHPALTPLKSPVNWVRELTGITIPDVAGYVVPASQLEQLRDLKASKLAKQALSTSRTSFLFTHAGLSGPMPMNVSRSVTDPLTPGPHLLICDFLPQEKETATREWLKQTQAEQGKRSVSVALSDHLPRRLVEALLQEGDLYRAGLQADQPLAEVSRSQLEAMYWSLRRLPIPLQGTLGYAKAEVTAGGVSLNEVDSSTMQSRCQRGLYLAGEILDLDGPIGGFNFQAAFSTAWLAADRIAEELESENQTVSASEP